MNNEEAQRNIELCNVDLQKIYHLIEGHGTSSIVPFLTNYSIVKACGTIEYCFKTIISDYLSGQSSQLNNYIDNTIRNSSMNPSRDNICRTLNKIDQEWNNEFKNKLNTHVNSARLKNSIDSLNSARNSFAHGDTPSSTFDDIKNYFEDSALIIEMLDEVITSS